MKSSTYRRAGQQDSNLIENKEGDHQNIMIKEFPRTKVLKLEDTWENRNESVTINIRQELY